MSLAALALVFLARILHCKVCCRLLASWALALVLTWTNEDSLERAALPNCVRALFLPLMAQHRKGQTTLKTP